MFPLKNLLIQAILFLTMGSLRRGFVRDETGVLRGKREMSEREYIGNRY
jgi:hypothetical protein